MIRGFLWIIMFLFLLISSVYSALSDNLVSYYPLDSTNGLNSTVGNVQTLEKGAAASQASEYMTMIRNSNSYVRTTTNTTPYVAPGRTYNWTVSLWFFSSDLTNNAYQCIWYQTNERHIPLVNNMADGICFKASGGGFYGVCNGPSLTGSENQWHHLAIVYRYIDASNGNWTIYVDNNKFSFLNSSADSDNAIIFGSFLTSNNLEGGLRDIGIWDRPLSDAEIALLYGYNGSTSFISSPSSPPTTARTIFPTQGLISILLTITLLSSYFLRKNNLF